MVMMILGGLNRLAPLHAKFICDVQKFTLNLGLEMQFGCFRALYGNLIAYPKYQSERLATKLVMVAR